MHESTVELLAELRALDVHLRVEDGRLRVNAPKGRLTPALEAAILRQKQALLESLAFRSQRRDLVPIPRDGTPLRLSFLQERLWVLDQLQPGHTAYNLAVCSTRYAGVDIDLLQTAIRRVVQRHEILRSRFVLEGVQPIVHLASADETPIDVRDLRHLSPDEQRDALNRAAPDATRQPFALATESPVRFTVMRTDDMSAAILMAAHHIAVDSWSMGLIGHEVTSEYAVLQQGLAPRPALALQYADYAHWQRELMETADAAERIRFWTDRLAALPAMSTFPPDFPRTADAPGTGSSLDFTLSQAQLTSVRAMARELNATLYMVLTAAMAVVLARNTGQSDVAIGSPIGTRDLSEIEGMLGPVLNPLVLRFNLADDPDFATLVARARDNVLDSHQHQDVPFEVLVQALNPARSLGHSPLFQVAVVLHNAPDASAVHIFSGGAIYDLALYATERDGALSGSIEYRADLYDETTIRRIASQLRAVLTSAVAVSRTPASAIPMLSAAEVTELLTTLNPPPEAVDQCTIVEQFLAVVSAHGAQVAVTASDATLTYAELDAQASAVARSLQLSGVSPGSVVALATDRSSAMVVGVLGILKAGAAYVPVDVSYPADRIAFMLSDCGATHVVTTGDALALLQGVPLPPRVVRVEEATALATATELVRVPIASDAAAYIIYTSGSTGAPKGVCVSHRAMSNFLGAMRIRPGLAASDSVLCTTSMSFDISVLEVFLPLVVGARTIIATVEEASDGGRLAALIRTARPSVVQSTPSGWRMLVQARWEGEPGITAVVGGETFPRDLAAWLIPRVKRVFNAYGPTETTVWSTLANIRAGDTITVGTPVSNTQIYVLDSAQQLVPIGTPGEIFIGGDGVADGYHGRPELTDERFVPDPFQPGRKMYRSGDYGRWRADGQLDHLGRADGQIKVRGYRIETGEIESGLFSHEMVRAAAVGVRHASADDPRLVAWVELHDDADCTVSELRRHLRKTLPEFMIPSMITIVDRFPTTLNGKIDRAGFPDPFASAMVVAREFIAPSTTTERKISAIWMTLLAVSRAGTTDNFFELGGHSLLAMRAAGEMSQQTGTLVEPRVLFFRTLGQLAEACDASARRADLAVRIS